MARAGIELPTWIGMRVAWSLSPRICSHTLLPTRKPRESDSWFLFESKCETDRNRYVDGKSSKKERQKTAADDAKQKGWCLMFGFCVLGVMMMRTVLYSTRCEWRTTKDAAKRTDRICLTPSLAREYQLTVMFLQFFKPLVLPIWKCSCCILEPTYEVKITWSKY